jgi:antitoxin MazE6
MKVAVSIPDPVFSEAELLAKRLRTSRSDIYARALDAFVGAYAPDRVTQALNDVVDGVDPRSDPFVSEAARRVLDQIEW